MATSWNGTPKNVHIYDHLDNTLALLAEPTRDNVPVAAKEWLSLAFSVSDQVPRTAECSGVKGQLGDCIEFLLHLGGVRGLQDPA